MIKKCKKLIALFTLLLCTCGVTSCNLDIGTEDNITTIVTTLYPNYEFINAILEGQKNIGQSIEVILIVPYGTDSHNYDPSISDYLTIKNADLFIYTSDEMEPWVSTLNLKEEKVLNIYEGMLEKYEDFKELQTIENEDIYDHEHKHEDEHNHDHDHDHEHDSYEQSDNFLDKILVTITNFLSLIFPHEHNHSYDPHFWTDMKYAEYMVEVIYDKLVEVIPDPYETKKIEMRKNADAYISNLRCLDRQFKSVVSLAQDKTIFFGSPFAFYYFTERYGLDYVLTYSTCSTEIDPSILVVLEVVKEMEHHNATVIFSKELTADDAAVKIAEYTGAEVLELHSGHNISAKDAGNVTFISIMQNNVTNLAKALKVPEYLIEDYKQTNGGVGNAD